MFVSPCHWRISLLQELSFSCDGEFGATSMSVVLLLEIREEDGVDGADNYDGYLWWRWQETLKSLFLLFPYRYCFLSLLLFPLSLGLWHRGSCEITVTVLITAVVFGWRCVALCH